MIMAYADISSTGFNLMDLSLNEMLLIWYSLHMANPKYFDQDQLAVIQRIVGEIDRIIKLHTE